MALNIKLLHGLSTALPTTKVNGRLLFCTDTKEIYFDINDDRIKLYDSLDTAKIDITNLKTLVGSTAVATQISDAIADLKKTVITEKEDSNSVAITISDNADSTAKKIKAEVKISAEAGNQASIKNDGIFVPAPTAADTYEIEQVADSDVDKTQYAAAYKLVKKAGGTGTGVQVGATINIIKDNFIDEVTLVNTNGTTPGKYIKITFKDTNTSTIYLDVKDLFNVYTGAAAADGIITVAVDASTGVITATIADGSVTKAKLETAVQTSLGLADTAVQPSELALAKTDNKYVAGIDVAGDGTITIQTETLPDISALQWGTFADISGS